MDNQEKRNLKPIIITVVAVLTIGALALGALALGSSAAQAQDETPVKPNPEWFGFGGPGGPGRHGDFVYGKGIDYDALLAEALGITVEELQAARQKADAAALEQAVAQGYLTEEQAGLIKAQRALMEYINKDELVAKALGISVEELQAAREEGKSMSALIEELGLDAANVREAMQAAYEEAVQQAVQDGVITEEQADQILSGEMGRGMFGGGKHGFGDRGGFPGGPDLPAPNGTPAPEGGL